MMISLFLALQLAATLTNYTTCYAAEMQLDNAWTIEVKFEDWPEGDQAETEVDMSYLTAYITYSLDALAEEPDSVLRLVVVHELTHVLTWEYGLLADEADEVRSLELFEQLATRVERWPVWLKLCTPKSNL